MKRIRCDDEEGLQLWSDEKCEVEDCGVLAHEGRREPHSGPSLSRLRTAVVSKWSDEACGQAVCVIG